ncbi:diphosphomevalonate decarboxylase [Companilactobacillus paralimentarius]|uniref:diphosphomevalonate decarboxylase n=1 Tax=Companilactobacillus bobalius TaxID=2801451 RepID=A0A202FFA1_9LACO|nr:diphosphomevalonate decarboxylase [Companilactobacillus bobalius]KAE9560442.1 diphosphomevalonate decarboxylase [Companilactobacillus bobalius]OVE99118.1 Diphosphomevalonate decarboxylase [Companilactobacillus bobalius]GEO57094.1 diphosphomevalonate decarboxylase [Companilactobacillus paralimentarius]
MVRTARAFTNIALIKYWGKKDQTLKLPWTNSLSLTLDRFYTDTKLTVADNDHDTVYLNHKLLDETQNKRILKYLDTVRKFYSFDDHFIVDTVNHVPTSAGFASSASGFAALAAAINETKQLNLNKKELSILARNGSGSASRSIYGGFVEWIAGDNNETSFATPIDENPQIDLTLLSVVINKGSKKISSTVGMENSVKTSPFYPNWVTLVASEIKEIKQAIAKKDIQRIGEIAEHNAMSMHALTLSANPSFTYFEPETIRIFQIIQELRQKGILAYATIDAGPNVKIICTNESITKVQKYIEEQLSNVSCVVANIGSGIQYI